MKPAISLLAAALLCLVCGAAGAQEMERLFFTPEQRQALDARRKARVMDKPAAAPAAAAPTLRMDGYVKRSRGPSTVWVNGESQIEGPQPEAPRIGEGAEPRVSVTVGDSPARVQLKPGEVLDRGNGEVRDVIGGGDIKVRRAPK